MRWVVALVLVACVQTNTRFCADGRLCPEDRICDDVHMMCVSQDQLDQCQGKPDRTHCISDVTRGQCDQGVCIPGCGDGVQQAGESCDDGGFSNHDGCSSVCELEVGGWRELPKPWPARSGHAAAYDSARQVLVIFGGLTQASSSADAGGAGDTWERSADGTWRQIDVVGPSPRQAAGMAFDAKRGVTVLFGGASSQGLLNGDTWEYDGAAWTQRAPIASPPVRRLHAMTYDSTRQVVVLYGGASETLQPFGDVWEYDGMTWTQRTTTGTPPMSRYATAIAYDDNRDRLVIFSGSRLDEDVWELAPDGSWTLASTGGGPKERYGAAMTYDPVTQRVLLFGGDDIASGLNDHWAWDGATWTVLSSPRTPPPRRFHTMTSVGTRVVLVAGAADLSEEPLDDVWTYDANGFRIERLGFTPSSRSNTPVAYDPVRDELVLYGGLLLQNDTWTFDGTRWNPKSVPQTAGLRNTHSTAWDAVRQRVVIYGGLAGGTVLPYDNAWSWDGSRWTLIQATTRPPGRAGAAMAGNAAGVIIMFGGGTNLDASGALFDTWELEGAAWRKIESAERPAYTFGPAMAYDPVADHMVLVDSDGATWTYRDGAWTLVIAAADGPGPRNFTTLMYHEARARIALYGGIAGTTVLTDLWELDGSTWRQVNAAGQPPAAQYSAVGYHRTQRSIVLFGGARSNALDQTWAFRHESALPDEVCTGGTDDDQDGLVDCDDPDCIYHPCPI